MDQKQTSLAAAKESGPTLKFAALHFGERFCASKDRKRRVAFPLRKTQVKPG